MLSARTEVLVGEGKAEHKFLDALRISVTLSILVLPHIYIKKSKICVL